MWRALTLLKQCRSAVKRGKTESGPTLAALCEVLLGGGCWGLSNMPKGGESLGKGQQLCRITKHFFFPGRKTCLPMVLQTWGWEEGLLPLPPPQVWQIHAEYSWMWRASWYGTRLDKTPNARLAESDPPFHISLCCMHQGMQFCSTPVLRGDSLSWWHASAVPCPAQQEIQTWVHFTHRAN